jgi:replication-associated recombination protein RarA
MIIDIDLTEELKDEILEKIRIQQRGSVQEIIHNYLMNNQEIVNTIVNKANESILLKVTEEAARENIEKINLAAGRMLIEFNSIDKIQPIIKEVETMKKRMDSLYFEMHAFMKEMKGSQDDFKNFKG